MKNTIHSEKQMFLKSLALLVSFSLFINQILFAHLPATSVWAERQQNARLFQNNPSGLLTPKKDTFLQKKEDFSNAFPTQFGTIRESHRVGSLPPILILQDVHLNLEAQGNLVKILSQLREHNRLGMVGVEGAFVPFNFKPFFDAGDQKIRSKVADEFISKNLIGAPSYVGVTSAEVPHNYFGIDDEPLYKANVASYKAGFEKQSSLSKAVAKQLLDLNEQKKNIFNPELMALDKIIGSYQKGTLGMGALLEKINPTTVQARRFLEAFKLEKKLDFALVEREKKQVLEKLIPLLTPKQTEGLTQLVMSHQGEKIQSSEFFHSLTKLMEGHRVSLASVPAFATYVRYATLADGVDADALIHETQVAMMNALQSLTQAKEEKELLQESNRLYLAEKLLAFSLTPQEWEEVQLINLDVAYEPFKNFYRYADARSEQITQNFLSLIAKHSIPGTPVLIIGGFHSPLVTQQFKARGLSYVMMSPTISKIEDATGTSYLSDFSRKKTPLEKLFDGEKLFINPQSLTLGTPGAPNVNAAFVAQERIGIASSKIIEVSGKKFFRGTGIPWGYARAGTPMVFEGQNLQPVLSFLDIFTGVVSSIQYWATKRMVVVPLSLLVATAVAFTSPTAFIHGSVLVLGFGLATVFSPAQPSSWLSQNVPILKNKKMIEVTMEMALPQWVFDLLENQEKLSDAEIQAVAMAGSAGGIGPLLKERVIEQAALGADVTGFSLLYEEVWVQEIVPNSDGSGKTHIEQKLKPVGNLLRKILIDDGTIKVKLHNESEIEARVWKSPPGMFGDGVVIFFDFPSITSVLYPGRNDAPQTNEAFRLAQGWLNGIPWTSEAHRLAQSWLLGRGTLGKIKEMALKSQLVLTKSQRKSPHLVITMSEMPSVFVGHRLFEDEYADDSFFENTVYIFNDHTPLDYAHPRWDQETMVRSKIGRKYYENSLVWSQDDSGKWLVDGTAMIVNAAHGVFGVAKKHAQVMIAMKLLSPFVGKIKSVTNGVSAAYWPHSDLSHWAALRDEEILIHKENERKKLIQWLANRSKMGNDWSEKMIAGGNPVGIWTRRLVEYKRADRFVDMVVDPTMREEFLETGIIFVLGGRIHQDDTFGTRQYDRLQEALAQDPRLKERVLFIENYNIWEAPNLFHGQNFSVMLANDGREASATGFQKAQMNGGLIIASSDGAVPESVVFFKPQDNPSDANGFEVPYEYFHDQKEKLQPSARGLLNAFKDFSAVYENKKLYGEMVRNALKKIRFVDVKRTAQDQLIFTGNIVEKVEKERQAFSEGKKAATDIFKRQNFTIASIKAHLKNLGRSGGFSWKFRPLMGPEVQLHHSHAGLEGFVAGAKHTREMGTIGEWSLNYHGVNNNGAGDITAHIMTILGYDDDLREFKEYVRGAAVQHQLAQSDLERRHINIRLLGMAEGLLELLKKHGHSHDKAFTAPGATGEWVSSGYSFWTIGMLEGLRIVGVVGLLSYVSQLLLPFILLPDTSKIIIWLTLSLFSLDIGERLIRWTHESKGVTYPLMSRPVFDPEVIKAAEKTARLSLIGIPLIVAAVVFLNWNSPALFVMGLLLSTIPHASRNQFVANDIVYKYNLSLLTDDELKQAKKIRISRKGGQDEESIIEDINALIKTNTKNLKDFMAINKVTSEEERESLAIRWNLQMFAQRGSGSPSHLFISNAATKLSRSFYGAPLASLVKRGEAYAFIPQNNDSPIHLIEEIITAKKGVSDENKMFVILNNKNAQFQGLISDLKLPNLVVLLERDLIVRGALENEILKPVLVAGNKLKFMMHPDSLDPNSALLKSILALSSTEDYRTLAIQFILTNIGEMRWDEHGENTFTQNPAVLATLEDMKAMMVFLAQA